MKKKTVSDAQKILNLLVNSTGPVTARQLAARARIPYGSVSKRIHDLRGDGYSVVTVKRKGIDGAKATSYTA
jgi:biotin operon repressor